MAVSQEFKDKIQHLAKMAAAKDHEEGGHRIGVNIAVMLAWAARVKCEHGACGTLTPRLEGKDTDGVECSAHGWIPAPEWKTA